MDKDILDSVAFDLFSTLPLIHRSISRSAPPATLKYFTVAHLSGIPTIPPEEIARPKK